MGLSRIVGVRPTHLLEVAVRLRSRYLALPLLAGVLLTGCARPGTAATVGGERITEESVSVLAADLATLQGTPAPPADALQSLIMSEPVLEAAAQVGAGVSRQQGVELLDTIAQQSGSTPWEYSDELVLVARMSVAAQNADEEFNAGVQEALTGLEVEVSPRYGTWDPTTFALQAQAWPWIVSADGATSTGG